MKRTYQEDEKELLKFYLDTQLLPPPNKPDTLTINNYLLEFIVKPECNQQCEYCYLYKYGNDLYPLNERKSNEEILNNIKILLNYLYFERKNYFTQIELFAGDLLYDGLLFEIFDIILEHFKKVKELYPTVIEQNPVVMILPTNLAAIYKNDELKEKINLYKRLLSEVNFDFGISWSSDGPYANNIREKNDNYTEDYYNELMKFCGEFGVGLHPMLSSESIESAEANYLWFYEKIKEYYGEESGVDWQPMLLEVRNDGWTQEKINKYLDFLNFMFDFRYEKIFNKDFEKFSKFHFFNYHSREECLRETGVNRLRNYDTLHIPRLGENKFDKDQKIPCSLQSSIIINCSNMSLVPCHRTSYSQFIGAYFIVENELIVDVEPHNLTAYITIHTHKKPLQPICSSCEYNEVCLHGCLGAQFEYSGEILLPIPSVCNLFKQKTDFLIKKHLEIGSLQYAIKHNYIVHQKEKEFFCNKAKEMGYDLNE